MNVGDRRREGKIGKWRERRKGEGKKDSRLQIKFSLEIENFLWGCEGVPIISRCPTIKRQLVHVAPVTKGKQP